jgi:hypothetical protein
MTPYVVKGVIRQLGYMQEEPKMIDDLRIVMADSVGKAREKYFDYWQGQTEEYSVYYSIHDFDIEETLK